MKRIHVKVSNDSSVDESIASLTSQISKATKDSVGFDLFYAQVIECIMDFSRRAKNLTRPGTTIHLEREISFTDLSVLIALDSPRKRGFFHKVREIFLGNK